jgi:hypothetical protein
MSQLTFAAYPHDLTHNGCYMPRSIERHVIFSVDKDLYNNHLACVAEQGICVPRIEPEVTSKRIEAIDLIDKGIDGQNL